MWQPSSDISTLKTRAELIAKVRHFFSHRNVLEVETPLLSNSTITDVHLDAFSTQFEHAEKASQQTLYLQTSPEFAMKRLLAAGSGPIFQICKAFRNEGVGRHHNPEFTMLEWYRPEFTDVDLMQEVDELMQYTLGCEPAIKMSYQQAFLSFLKINPLTISLLDLQNLAFDIRPDNWLKGESNKDTLLQWLFSFEIEPKLGRLPNETYQPVFIYDFPASQAALAKIKAADERVAHRFELYFKGIELANGYYELQDVDEQVARFNQDNETRKSIGKVTKPIDQNFIAAMKAGLPDCSGVALGLDRLLMCYLESKHIKQVISFDQPRA
jgi:elongation factor P--(R)-beta-lysine ligase